MLDGDPTDRGVSHAAAPQWRYAGAGGRRTNPAQAAWLHRCHLCHIRYDDYRRRTPSPRAARACPLAGVRRPDCRTRVVVVGEMRELRRRPEPRRLRVAMRVCSTLSLVAHTLACM